MILEFKATDKARASRKALDFWYKNLKDKMFLKDFLSKCKYCEEDGLFIIYLNLNTKAVS